jgi:hypothetical protein
MPAAPHLPPPGATFRPLLVTPAGPASFSTNDTDALAEHFVAARRWTRAAGRSQHEHSRLSCPGCVVVLYFSGTALVQGARPELGRAVLAELAEVTP